MTNKTAIRKDVANMKALLDGWGKDVAYYCGAYETFQNIIDDLKWELGELEERVRNSFGPLEDVAQCCEIINLWNQRKKLDARKNS